MAAGESDDQQIDESTAELLQMKGTLKIISEIGEKGPRRHSDLRDDLLLSPSTIQRRLKEGKEQGLWEVTLEDREGVEAKVNKLTPLGEQIYSHIRKNDLPKLYDIHRGLIRSIDNRERKVIVSVSPSDADWLTELSMEQYEFESVQQLISQYVETDHNQD